MVNQQIRLVVEMDTGPLAGLLSYSFPVEVVAE